MRALLLVLVLALLPSLSQAETAQFPIVNGSPEPGHDSVVALGAALGPFAFSACTGAVITPRLVLTAGHCGAGYTLEQVVAVGSAMFGEVVGEHDVQIGFTDLVQHEDYTPILADEFGSIPPANDISVLELAEDAPYRPLWFNRLPLSTDEHEGTELLSVGYGITGIGADDGGTRRSAPLTLDALQDDFIYSRSDTNPNNANTCSGDSGGPMMWQADDGQWVIWGVHSWGDQGCLQVSGSTRTDLFMEWILDRVEEVHGTRDVCAANGWYGDEVCDPWCDDPDPDCPSEGDDDDSAEPDDDDSAEPDDDDGLAGNGCAGCATSPAPARAAPALLLLLAFRRRR